MRIDDSHGGARAACIHSCVDMTAPESSVIQVSLLLARQVRPRGGQAPECKNSDKRSMFGLLVSGTRQEAAELCTNGRCLVACKGAFPCAGTF